MKKEFRIIEYKTCNDLEECITIYYIQKKFLYWWFDYRFHILNDNNTLSKKLYTFKSKNECTRMIEKLKEDDWISYKKNNIKRVFTHDSLKLIFVNTNNSIWKDHIGYIYYDNSYSLSILKQNIDRKITTITKKVL